MTNKNALITGGSRGLGLEVGRLLAGNGYRLTIVGRNAAHLEAATRSFAGGGHRAWGFDLSRPADTHELLVRLRDESFDLLINNSGASRFGPLQELSAAEVEGLIYLNLTTPALIGWQFLQTSQPGATLVNVTSALGLVPMPGNSVYCAAKAGLRALSECLWFEARRKNVQVLDFCPLTLRTDFHRLAGGKSLSSSRMAVDPAVAARDLVRAIERGRDFIYPYGRFMRLLEAANRLLPRRLLVRAMGKRSGRAGYLG